MENQSTVVLDSTVRSQDSDKSSNSKRSKQSIASKAESCQESKHSKEVLLTEKQHRQQQQQVQVHPHQQHHQQHHHHHPHAHPQSQSQSQEQSRRVKRARERDDTGILMLASCGQLLLGVVLVVFGVLVLVHGASLGGSGAGLWAGAGALVAGALGVVGTLATSSNKSTSAFSTAHLASSLVALALSNMAAITALTAVVRDSQRTSELTLLAVPGEHGETIEVEGGWAGLVASIGLLIASVAELLVSGYSCVTLTPKLCGCLRSTAEDGPDGGRLKTRNMVHQWVIAQNHVPKTQPIYVVQPMLPVHPMMQAPYAIPPPPPPTPGKFPGGYLPAGTLPIAAGPGYGAVPVLPHLPFPTRPPSQMVRSKQKRHLEQEEIAERKRHPDGKGESPRRMSSIGEDQVDLAQTYTGLDKKISEEFISIAMDPDRKSKASSSQHGSEIGASKRN